MGIIVLRVIDIRSADGVQLSSVRVREFSRLATSKMYSSTPFSARPLSDGSFDGDRHELANKSEKVSRMALACDRFGSDEPSGSGGAEIAVSGG